MKIKFKSISFAVSIGVLTVFNLANYSIASALPITTTRINTDSTGAQTSGLDSQILGLTKDGQKILFSSYSSTLVSGDTNNHPDIFLKIKTITVSKE